MTSRTTRPLVFAGPDAAAFAQAQLSSDLRSLAVGRWQWSGWLDPKGRVRALLQVARLADDRFVAVPRGGDGETLATALMRFVFRAKVTIATLPSLRVADGEAQPDGFAHESDDGAIVLGEGDASIRVGTQDDGDAWVGRHMRKGFAWLPEVVLGELLPPALSMERLGAVAFDKGCFPGQEIAARLHFLGGHKRHLRLARSDEPLREGQTLRANGRDVGIVLMHAVLDATPTSLVVLDDAASQEDTIENDGTRLHVLSTFDA